MTPAPALPDEVRVELERVARRWQQLPVDHALRASGPVRVVAHRLAADVAGHRGLPATVLPDLGPATLLHQLQVCVYDAVVEGAVDPRVVTERLRGLRRDIG